MSVIPNVGGVSFTHNSKIYIVGGADQRQYEKGEEKITNDIFNIREFKEKIEFISIGKLNVARVNPKIIVYKNGQVVVFGGCQLPILETFIIKDNKAGNYNSIDLSSHFSQF